MDEQNSTLEEQLDRYGESARRRVAPSLETFGKQLTRPEAVACARGPGAPRCVGSCGAGVAESSFFWLHDSVVAR